MPAGWEKRKETVMDNWLETKQFPVHFVAAAGVVYREDGKILLIRSARRGWEFPGGVVEQGESILDGLKREILEESGVTAEPVYLTGIYQNVARKKGYGPLEGMTLPTTVNMFFRCRYVSGEGTVTEESLETGWFTPEEALERITAPYLLKALEDINALDGKQHFAAFRKPDREMEFVSESVLGTEGSGNRPET